MLKPQDLRAVRSIDDVIELLAEDLDWPLGASELEEATFEFTAGDLGLAEEQVPQLRRLRQLRPLTAGQPWGVFFVELDGPRLPLNALRRLLRVLVQRKRTTVSDRQLYQQEDLLFFTTTSSGQDVEVHLLAFADRERGEAEIRSLPWSPRGSTDRQLERLTEELLPRLAWPEEPSDADRWRAAWREAFRLRHGEALQSAVALAQRMAGVAIDVREAIRTQIAREAGEGPFSLLREEVRKELDPRVDDEAFADMCAQTLVSGALTARVVDPDGFGASPVLAAVPLANPFLEAFFAQVHDLIAAIDLDQAGFDQLVADLRETQVEAVLDAFGQSASGGDPVIHFYERFLAEYDPTIRAEVGAYFTPQPVVEGIVALVDDALRDRLLLAAGAADTSSWGQASARLGRAVPPGVDPDDRFVDVLDPATGTGTFLVAWLRKDRTAYTGLDWDGHLRTQVLPHLRAFELLLAPYAIAHLKLSMEAGADAAADTAASVLLTDTLEWGAPAPVLDDFDPVAAEGLRASHVKEYGRPTVILGNPPYQRVRREDGGGWITGASGGPRGALIDDWLRDAQRRGVIFSAQASLYDRYVYFWRWAMWKAFEQRPEAPGIVAFITGAGWLDGPAFSGVRESARRLSSEVWVVELGGDGRGTDREENVFDIQTPVAITVLVRGAAGNDDAPARVWHRRVHGTRAEKLVAARALRGPHKDRDAWTELPSADGELFKPSAGDSDWLALPALNDLLPWQQPGAKLDRTWPVAPDRRTLARRWTEFLADPDEEVRAGLLPTKGSGRNIRTNVAGLRTLADEPSGAQPQPVARYAWRAFDRQWTFRDPRLAKTESPALWQSLGPHQIFLMQLVTVPIGPGPALIVSTAVPDMACFRGSFGGKDVLPLYRDRDAQQPNVTAGLLAAIGSRHGATDLTPEELAAYIYALLSTPAYQQRFAVPLADRVLRVPLTADPALWREAVELGEELLWLHTFGERFGRSCGFDRADELPDTGVTLDRQITRIPADRSDLRYDSESESLTIADGTVTGVPVEVWEFEVSGWPVVSRWLEHRMLVRRPGSRASSELDEVRPDSWPRQWTDELLTLLRALAASTAVRPSQDDLLVRIVEGPLIEASDLPSPREAERRVPRTIPRHEGQQRLH